MRKLTLHPDDLSVQSFPTEDVEWKPGTVHGMSGTCPDQDSCGDTCQPGCTDVDTCPAVTCAASCLGSCVTCPQSCDPAQCPSSDGRC